MNINKTMSSALLLLAICLITACSAGDAPPVTTAAPAANSSVVANAGPDQSVFTGTFVTLNGSNSTNANGTGLTYAWTMNKPVGSNAALSNPNIVNPTFTPDVGGIYQCTLVVSSGTVNSAPSTVSISAAGINPPPVANAGTNQSVFVGRPALLNGSGSSDANSDPLTFAWSFSGLPAGSSNPTIFDRTTVAPSFTPDIAGTYIIQLVVNDGTSSSSPAFVTVIASNKPSPTANAGTDRFIALNTPSVTLDGSGSGTNPPGETLEYLWTFNAPTSPPTISNNTSAVASFVPLTNVAATYVAQLRVTEPNHLGPLPNIGMDTVSVTVGPLTVIRVSKVTPLTLLSTCTVTSCPSVPVQQNTQLQLDGSTSLVQPLTYQWSMTPTTGGVLTSTTSAVATFTPALNVTGNFTITLTVRDGGNNTNTRSVTIMVVTGPIVNSVGVGAASVLPNTTVLVTAAISGVTGTTPTCTWIPSSSNVVITPLTCTPTSATANIRATQAGTYSPSLTVTDSIGSGSRQFTFSVNTPPTVTLTPTSSNQGVCSAITLTGTATDADGDALSLPQWSIAPPQSQTNGAVTYSSLVTIATIQVMTRDTPAPPLFDTVTNPAFFTGSSTLPTSSRTFMPDLSGPFTATLSVAETKVGGVTTTVQSVITGQDSYNLGGTSTNPTILATYTNTCAGCHSLPIWNDQAGSPNLSGKGLHVNARLTGAVGGNTSHAFSLTTDQLHDLCVLSNDINH